MHQAKRLINFKIHQTLIGSWILMESWVLLGSWVLSGSWVSFFQYALKHGLLWKDNLMLGWCCSIIGLVTNQKRLSNLSNSVCHVLKQHGAPIKRTNLALKRTLAKIYEYLYKHLANSTKAVLNRCLVQIGNISFHSWNLFWTPGCGQKGPVN